MRGFLGGSRNFGVVPTIVGSGWMRESGAGGKWAVMKTAETRMFRGWDAPLEVDGVLSAEEVFTAHDHQGTRYVMAHTTGATWLCAPISTRALECVTSGRAELRAVFTHSATGMVERLTVRAGTVLGESILPCSELPDDVLPRPGVRLGWQARCA